MSSIEPDEQLVADEELRSVLENWNAPAPSESLDQRVLNSYHRQAQRLDAVADPNPLALRKNEVVAMKFCSTCRDEYADKFSFCPVDGTPLNNAAPQAQESTVTAVQVEPPRVSEPLPQITQTEASFEEPAVPALAGIQSGSLAMSHEREEFHLTFLDDKGLVPRLAQELREVAHEYELTWPEFKRDPFGFTKRSLVGYGQMAGRFLHNRNAMMAIGIAVLVMIVAVAGIAYMDRSGAGGVSRTSVIVFAVIAFAMLVALFATWLGKDRGAVVAGAEPSDSRYVVVAMGASFIFITALLASVIFFDKQGSALLASNDEEGLQVEQVFDIPQEQPTPEPGTAGFNKGSGGGSKPKPEKAGGGGGGGRQERTPASAGKLPQASLEVPQILPPDPKPPVVKNPSLPVAATVVADPLLVPPDARVLPYGDPRSTSTVASSGPGTGNGIGSGTGTGVGPGDGGGVGPGRGGNIGGGDRRDGGGGPGGGGGGTDYNKIFSGRDVTSKARVLSKPEPQYTEEARKNQITGTVVLRAVFSSGGQVTQIRTISGLPHGLTERAMAAARQIKFVPATKDGRPVSMWMELQYNFNLY